MKNIFKKNQIIVFVIGLMFIAAGYLNFTNTEKQSPETGALADAEEMASIGDAKLVSASNIVETNNLTDEEAVNSNEVEENETNQTEDNSVEADNTLENSITDNEESVETNANETDDYFTTSKLERENMYSQRLENYQKILNNTNVSESQKKLAQEEISSIGDEQNAIMIAENLIKTKGIEDLIIFVNDENINVIIKGEELEKAQIAQVQNIITRELGANIENIHIMNK